MSRITAKTKICMVIGDPIDHSLSPQMFNRAYETMGIDDSYVYIASNVKKNHLPHFIQGVKAMGIRGVSCTIPHKVEVMKHLDQIDETAKIIGAVNTIVNDQGVLKGYNTDWLGIVNSLEKITPIKNKKIALLGAGGTARAVAYGITEKRGKLTVFNRTIEKAQRLSKIFGCEALPLNKLHQIKDMDIIINATSVGLTPHENESILPKKIINKNHIVFDCIYNPYETLLLKHAKEQGAIRIHGTEMLLHQGLAQFKLYTGTSAPEDLLRTILLQNIQ